jgi:acetylornithine deacetylase
MNTLQLLDRLISFPTVSRDSNLDLIHFVAEYLGARSAAVRLFKSPDGRKANLFATLGPRDRAGVLLSGHTDVVPVDGQQWSSDPFCLKEEGDALYGRGTADMKGFLACALTAADQASQRQLKLPLHLAFSYDEEIGCVGVRSLIQDMQTWAILPTLCIGSP